MSATPASGFRARLRRRERLIGAIVSLGIPEVTEIIATSGHDWLFLDAEHGPLGTLMHRLPAFAACPRAALQVAESIERRLINIPSSAGLLTVA